MLKYQYHVSLVGWTAIGTVGCWTSTGRIPLRYKLESYYQPLERYSQSFGRWAAKAFTPEPNPDTLTLSLDGG